jgi:hypothetical protein
VSLPGLLPVPEQPELQQGPVPEREQPELQQVPLPLALLVALASLASGRHRTLPH